MILRVWEEISRFCVALDGTDFRFGIWEAWRGEWESNSLCIEDTLREGRSFDLISCGGLVD